MSISSNYDSVFAQIVRDVLQNGDQVTQGAGRSIGAERTTAELLNYSFQLTVPQDRLLFHPSRRINIFSAVGRFVWMMSGSNRVDDIAFYDAKAKAFSDDGLIIPGSSDGARLIYPRTGLNQLQNVINLLQHESGSRRGAVTIYHPEDVGRESKDIPCTIGLTYNIRRHGLVATTLMRSNNVIGPLPLDVFLYSLLAEIIACSLGVNFYQYHHFAVSMHIYKEDYDLAKELSKVPDNLPRWTMKPMPVDSVMEQITKLILLASDLKRDYIILEPALIQQYLNRIEKDFLPYWQDFAHVLFIHALYKDRSSAHKLIEIAKQVIQLLSEPFQLLISKRG